MNFARWKGPLLAWVAASPLFGCALNPQTMSGPFIAPAADPWTRWARYQQVIDRQMVAEEIARLDFNPSLPSLPRTDRLASDAQTEVASDDRVFDQRILAAHNRERNGLGLVPLSWNPVLARSARRWADFLASTGRFEHAPENRVTPEGENLWAGTKGYFSPEAMVDAWIREKKYFRPGTFPDNSTTGRVEDVGHYTQLVWRATTQVGCAEARSRSEDILVCRYAEAGNYRGEVPF